MRDTEVIKEHHAPGHGDVISRKDDNAHRNAQMHPPPLCLGWLCFRVCLSCDKLRDKVNWSRGRCRPAMDSKVPDPGPLQPSFPAQGRLAGRMAGFWRGCRVSNVHCLVFIMGLLPLSRPTVMREAWASVLAADLASAQSSHALACYCARWRSQTKICSVTQVICQGYDTEQA